MVTGNRPEDIPAEKMLRYSLLSLAAVVCVVGLYTLSWKKMVVVYASGLFFIAGIVLPDWDFFNRDVSHWCTPLPATQPRIQPRPFRFKLYPLRWFIYSIVYGFGLYKLWCYVTS